MIAATLRFGRSHELLALLRAEQASFTHARTGYTVQEREEHIIVEIEAADATALKTVVTSVCRIVTVFEKAKGVA